MNAARVVRAGGFAAAALVVGVCVSATAQPDGRPDPAKLIVTDLQLNVLKARQDAQGVEAQLKDARKDLDRLKEKVKTVPPPKDRPPAAPEEKAIDSLVGGGGAGPKDEKKDGKEVDFRLPMARKSKRDTKLAIVCLNKRAYLADFEAIDRAIRDDPAVLKTGGTVRAAAGDFDLKVTVAGGVRSEELALKPDRTGETPEQAKSRGSAFLTRLAKLKPEENVLQFCVYPDSFDVFRELRAVAWEKDFDEVGWHPVPVGLPIRLGSGPAIIN
jgi:hypothetical protein